jgi:glucarate dehydratase
MHAPFKKRPGFTMKWSPDASYISSISFIFILWHKNSLYCITYLPQQRVNIIMCEFKNATPIPVATNMIATDWRQFYHAAALKSVDIVLADPHFWGMNGTVKMAQILNDWGLTWGSHSNNHFDITLTVYAHVAAAAPGNPTPIDTHWIWQDGQNLCENTPKIEDGYLEVPETPGLGIQPNMERIMAANALYNKMNDYDRNDALAMQYLIPDWKFDSKKPALVR